MTKKTKTPEEKTAEARKKIDDLISKADDAIYEASEIADEFGLAFDYHPENVGTYNPRKLLWAASDGCEWETSDEWSEGSWSPADIEWSSSSNC